MPPGFFAALDSPYKPKYKIRENFEAPIRKPVCNLSDKIKVELSNDEMQICNALFQEGVLSISSLLYRIDMDEDELQRSIDNMVSMGFIARIELKDEENSYLYKLDI